MFMNQWKDEKVLDISSDEEPYDSDQINSDIEAELYSIIHYETTNSTVNYKESLTTSDKENTSGSFPYEGLRKNLNDKLEKDNEKLLNRSNSAYAQVIEAANQFSFSSDGEIHDFNLQHCNKNQENSKRISLDLDNAQSLNKKQKVSSSLISKFLSKTDETSSEDDNNVIYLNSSDKQLFSNHKNYTCSKSLDEQLSSNSDDDIICIKSRDTQQCFETNVTQNVHVITDSDSDSVGSWCFKSGSNVTSTPNVSKKDLWYINNNDLNRSSRRNSSRFYESESSICNHCKQKGHSSKFCSFSKGAKCYICGGLHGPFKCWKRICAKCFGVGHDAKYCAKQSQFCNLCQMLGHQKEICPERWRRFQRTCNGNKPLQIWRLTQDTPFYCYNCGSSEHFGPFCNHPPMRTFTFPTWPYPLNFKVKPSAIPPMITDVKKESFNANEEQKQNPKPKKKKKKKIPKHNVKSMSQAETINGKKEPIWLKFKLRSLEKKRRNEESLSPSERKKEQKWKKYKLRQHEKKLRKSNNMSKESSF